MRIFMTGATGFIGGHVARKLAARGDQVVALVRTPSKAGELAALGIELVKGDLGDIDAIDAGLKNADAAIHGAAIYEVGIPASRREPMRLANVEGTQNVLDAIWRAGTKKAVYVSTIGVFGNTHGKVVDENYEHPGKEFGSYYEQTKVEAHKIAKRFIADGLPLVIVQPGFVLGPKDHSEVGQLLLRFAKHRLPALAFPETGANGVYVEDVADGVLLALDKGRVGESYVLGGEIVTTGEIFAKAAKVLGRRPLRMMVPSGLIKAITPLGPLLAKPMKLPPNLREAYNSAHDYTYWASHEKAMKELGFAPRNMETALRDTFKAEGFKVTD